MEVKLVLMQEAQKEWDNKQAWWEAMTITGLVGGNSDRLGQKQGGSKPGKRRYNYRHRHQGHYRIWKISLAKTPIYNERQFRRTGGGTE